jgi:hypothetical protein
MTRAQKKTFFMFLFLRVPPLHAVFALFSNLESLLLNDVGHYVTLRYFFSRLVLRSVGDSRRWGEEISSECYLSLLSFLASEVVRESGINGNPPFSLLQSRKLSHGLLSGWESHLSSLLWQLATLYFKTRQTTPNLFISVNIIEF